jgi:phosphoribosylformimino-5-aminoimidazole carboxamide ribonucleotide (ProFAR) isomerase
MILYPAIDIRDGKAVRLTQGDFAQETVYDAEPLSAARAWVEGGARWLHVVDLDGARDPGALGADRRRARRAGAVRRRPALVGVDRGGAGGRR